MGPTCHCKQAGWGRTESCCPVHGGGVTTEGAWYTPKIPPYILTDHLQLEEGHWIAVLRDEDWISGKLKYDSSVGVPQTYDSLLFVYGPRSSSFYPSRDLASNHTVVVLAEPEPKIKINVTAESVLGLEYVIQYPNVSDKVQVERLTEAARRVIKSKEKNAS